MMKRLNTISCRLTDVELNVLRSEASRNGISISEQLRLKIVKNVNALNEVEVPQKRAGRV